MISRIKLLWHLISFPFPCYLGMFPLLFLINLPDSPFLFPNICCKNQVFFFLLQKSDFISVAKIRFFFSAAKIGFFSPLRSRCSRNRPFPGAIHGVHPLDPTPRPREEREGLGGAADPGSRNGIGIQDGNLVPIQREARGDGGTDCLKLLGGRKINKIK